VVSHRLALSEGTSRNEDGDRRKGDCDVQAEWEKTMPGYIREADSTWRRIKDGRHLRCDEHNIQDANYAVPSFQQLLKKGEISGPDRCHTTVNRGVNWIGQFEKDHS
jgi:hypothetical protein